jgi:uncharacterized protein (TIGR03067 family)
VLTLVISLLIAQSSGAGDKPTAAQVEQAHRLLNGEWEIVSYTDDGESLGPGLIRAKLAKDGRIKVGARSFQIVNPETNEVRSSPFRLNPVKNPKQIEITSRDDRSVGGIYKFDGDNLIVCLEGFPDSGYPSDFEAPTGSNWTLIKLKMVNPKAVVEAPPELKAEVAPSSAVEPTPAEHAARVTSATARKPTPAELTRVRELFAGNWDILSIVDDGEKLGSELIRRRFAENGRIRFGTRSLAIVNPKTEARNVNAYRLDPTKSPSEIDVTTQFDTVLKGIYVFDYDKLTVCLAKNEDGVRPDSFEAPGGSGRMLFRLQLAKDDLPTTATSYQPEPAPRAEPRTSAESEAREFDTKVRRLVTGSWAMTDGKGNMTAVFQPNGDFVATRTWARGSKRIFGPPSDSSRGSWVYRDGLLSAWVTSTTDPRIAGNRINARIQTIGDDTMVVTDAYGSVKTFRRLR